MQIPETCPKCGFHLDNGDIFEVLRDIPSYKNRTDEEVKEIARNCGWSEENRKRFSKAIVNVSRGRGKSSMTITCPNCNSRI